MEDGASKIDYLARLNDKQKKFVLLYCEYNGNGSRAAHDAGYETRAN